MRGNPGKGTYTNVAKQRIGKKQDTNLRSIFKNRIQRILN